MTTTPKPRCCGDEPPTAWGIVFTLLLGYGCFALLMVLLSMMGGSKEIIGGVLYFGAAIVTLIIVVMGIQHVIEHDGW